MLFVRRGVVLAIGILSIFQWEVVLERAFAAIWAWDKFFGYGNKGCIIVGKTTQLIFLLGSSSISVVGYVLYRVEVKDSKPKFWGNLSRFVWISITICTLLWIIFLVSPLVKFDVN